MNPKNKDKYYYMQYILYLDILCSHCVKVLSTGGTLLISLSFLDIPSCGYKKIILGPPPSSRPPVWREQ